MRVDVDSACTRCQPKRRTIARGSALNVPTKKVLNAAPFHPLCSRDLTGKRSYTTFTLLNPSSSDVNSRGENLRSTGAPSCSRSTRINFESALSHDCRLYAWRMASPPGFSTRRIWRSAAAGSGMEHSVNVDTTQSKL